MELCDFVWRPSLIFTPKATARVDPHSEPPVASANATQAAHRMTGDDNLFVLLEQARNIGGMARQAVGCAMGGPPMAAKIGNEPAPFPALLRSGNMPFQTSPLAPSPCSSSSVGPAEPPSST